MATALPDSGCAGAAAFVALETFDDPTNHEGDGIVFGALTVIDALAGTAAGLAIGLFAAP